MGTLNELEAFVTAHRACGRLEGDAGAPTSLGYCLWVACVCGARLERWIAPEAADRDLLAWGVFGSMN
jgi:hypothetical protein